jgi:hypothetical protein
MVHPSEIEEFTVENEKCFPAELFLGLQEKGGTIMEFRNEGRNFIVANRASAIFD